MDTIEQKLSSSTLEEKIEPDNQDEDDEESLKEYGSTYASSLFTAASEHSFEHGRRYYDAQERMRQYWSPDDKEAQDIGDLVHEALRVVQKDKVFAAPIENPENIIDLGTSTGLVALELGEIFPNAQVVGTDINPVPLPVYSPDNVKFMVEDFTAPTWSFPLNHFDFIHARLLHGSMSETEWPVFFRKAYAHTKPGGWMEVTEMNIINHSDDDTVDERSPLYIVGFLAMKASENMGRPMVILNKVEGWMKDAGFVDIKLVPRKLPVGRWPKRKDMKLAGDMMARVMIEGIVGFTTRLFTIGLGMTADEATRACAGYAPAVKDRSVHSYFPVLTVYGRRRQ